MVHGHHQHSGGRGLRGRVMRAVLVFASDTLFLFCPVPLTVVVHSDSTTQTFSVHHVLVLSPLSS